MRRQCDHFLLVICLEQVVRVWSYDHSGDSLLVVSGQSGTSEIRADAIMVPYQSSKITLLFYTLLRASPWKCFSPCQWPTFSLPIDRRPSSFTFILF